MMKCDTLLIVGSSFPYSESVPEEGQARGSRTISMERMHSIRDPMDVNLIGDSPATLRALLPHVEHKSDLAWHDSIEEDVAEWWRCSSTRTQRGDPCAVPAVRHTEYFHGHVRIEPLFCEGVATPRDGQFALDRSPAGLGFELNRADAAPYQVC